MLDESRIHEVLTHYKETFGSEDWWDKEKFKWQAVKTFQTHWNLEADDFAGMLKQSLSGALPLLVSANKFPEKMIIEFAEHSPEAVREMFTGLFEESQDIFERTHRFKQQAQEQLEQVRDDDFAHYQDENTQSIYLWLRFPDRYFLYKWGLMRNAARRLGSDFRFKRGAYEQNIRNHLLLGQEITDVLKADPDLADILTSRMEPSCYPDPELKTLTGDFIFYLDTAAPNTDTSGEELSEDFDPGFSTTEWIELLNDPEIFTPSALEVVKRIYDLGGEATRPQLARKYGKSYAFYNSSASSLGQRVAERKGVARPNGHFGLKRWWPMLFTGRQSETAEVRDFAWRLHDNLTLALEEVDLDDVPLYASEVMDVEQSAQAHPEEQNFWLLSANPKIWSFASHSVGGEQWYSLRNENGNKRRIYQNFLDAKPGDWVIGYESTPHKMITALARVTREQDGERIYFEKVETLLNPVSYEELQETPELQDSEFFTNLRGSFFGFSQDEYDTVMDLIREKNPLPEEQDTPSYHRQDFLEEVFMDEQQYDRLAGVLRHKKNLILQGAPGVGKTFAAKRLAYSMMGETDDSRVELVQFHQNYSYEEFVMGFRPSDDGFSLKNGIFFEFCRRAANEPHQEHFFIIDEINRGNLSRIFGELLMLIENDYRGDKATLAYSGTSFSVPPNVHIIGMMNTADRSLAMLDYALRRRFSFFELEPGFSTPGFQQRLAGEGHPQLDQAVDVVQRLNHEIAQDASLGRGFCIGHSYFLRNTVEQPVDVWLHAVIEYDIVPMLEEYWFDNDDQLDRWKSELRGVLL